MMNDENIVSVGRIHSSPRIPSSSAGGTKLKKPPPITPKRFNRFFAPRSSSTSGTFSRSSHVLSQGRSARRLRDITRNAVNREGPQFAEKFSGKRARDVSDEGINITPKSTRRKISQRHHDAVSPCPSSPPLSSPIRPPSRLRNSTYEGDDRFSSEGEYEDHRCATSRDTYQKGFPRPITRLKSSGTTSRILHRSFGGADAIGRSFRRDHCTSWKSQSSEFYSLHDDCHFFDSDSLPFCATSCRTNSLVAIGDEEGAVWLLDSAAEHRGAFTKTHLRMPVHSNAVMDLAFSSDDLTLATASGDQSGRIIDMMKQKTKHILAGHNSSLKQVCFQPGNDNIVATSSRDSHLFLWDLRCQSSEAAALTVRSHDLGSDSVESQDFRHASTFKKIFGAHGDLNFVPGRPVAAGRNSSARLGSNGGKPHATFGRGAASVTAVSFLPSGREHFFLTASEANASVKLWDIRGKYTSRRGVGTPVSATQIPQSHLRSRNYGINSISLSGDGNRLYTVCRDSTVYAYAMNQLIATPMPTAGNARRPGESGDGAGPIYGFKNPHFRTRTFYVKSSVRPATGHGCEMLAVGSSDGKAILFPTDERYLSACPILNGWATGQSFGEQDRPSRATCGNPLGLQTPPSSQDVGDDLFPIFEYGTALIEGHTKEVTSLAWTYDLDLVTCSDDFRARCWREGGKARQLRSGSTSPAAKWLCGWAEVPAGYDEDD